MKAGQKLAFDSLQVALFPLENMRITQGVDGVLSHRKTKALDLSTVGVFDTAYAPFDCEVVYKSKVFNAGVSCSMMFNSIVYSPFGLFQPLVNIEMLVCGSNHQYFTSCVWVNTVGVQ